jgi:type IX secretion system PorP/SprF family membrane protein
LHKIINMKKFKKSLLSLLLLLISISSVAQQDAQYSMYMFNPLAVNPAYAGSRGALSATLLHRSQWVGLDGAPQTQTLSIHSPLRNESIGLGFSLVNDKIGANKNTGLYADFAYRIQLNRHNDKLAFGVKGGVDLFSSDFNDLAVTDNTDDVYLTPLSNKTMPNFGFGVYYYGKRHYVGLTVPKLVQNDLSGGNSTITATQDRHFFFIAGYVFKLSSTVDFKPSVIAKMTAGAPLSTDFNASFLFYEKLWLGAMYRHGDSFGLNVVYNFTEFLRAGYAYDYTTTELGNYNNGSHEIMIGFDLQTNSKSFKTPRFF